MDRSPGFGSTSCYLTPYSDSLSLRLQTIQSLTLQHNVTRRSVLQKVHGRTYIVLPLLVNTGFQVLFHSPPGVLFTFPSRYYALSVTISYLGLGGGPPASHRISRVLRYSGTGWLSSRFRRTGLSPSLEALSNALPLPLPQCLFAGPQPQRACCSGLASFPFARRYLGNRCFFLFLRVLRCFSSPGALLDELCIHSTDDWTLLQPGFPIRISTNQCLLAAPRSLSQLATSFFGVWCPGIHPVLLFA